MLIMADCRSVREVIDEKLLADKDFCIGIAKCESREEAKKFLSANNIEASDDDMDYLSKKILQASEKCSQLSEEDMDKISGGADIPAEKVAIGVGIAAVAVFSVEFLKLANKKMKKKLWWSPFK